MKHAILILFCLLSSLTIQAQTVKQIKTSVEKFVKNYSNPAYSNQEKYKVEDIVLKSGSREMEIQLSETFLGQPFTEEVVERIKSELRSSLPQNFRGWSITVTVNGNEISQLIASYRRKPSERRTWEGIESKELPWVRNDSRPFVPTNGLEGRHIALWASHGRYYSHKRNEWVWQRPEMNATLEDLFTSTIVIPYLMPMLERSGAILFSPRERSWQKHEIISDDKDSYVANAAHKWMRFDNGFEWLRAQYTDGMNPFEEGQSHAVKTQKSTHRNSFFLWKPTITEAGDYPVYVSYANLGDNVPDAHYTIRHEGMETEISVNQRMGAGTWVYLGTWHFGANDADNNNIRLSNVSNFEGRVSADAIRLGGGIGNVIRSGELSGLGRAWEGARYSAQWYGMPMQTYLTKDSGDDYGEDINVRSLSVNHVARGSVYVPKDSIDMCTIAENGTDTLEKWKEERDGLHVPIELCLAVHSDAGLRKTDELIGSLAIYTGSAFDGKIGAGPSRLVNRDLADLMLDVFSSEMTKQFGRWNRRQIYDRNYSETRLPQMPSIILETLSHQNFADMRYGNDPYCTFFMARAIYKAVLQYINQMHGNDNFVVQPMPVEDFTAEAIASEGKILLRWNNNEKEDSPVDSYILYTAIDNNGWDNGQIIKHNECSIKAEEGKLYRFRLTAVNRGGESMDSPTIAARIGNKNSKSLLLVDCFNRVASAQVIDNDTLRGFLPSADPGVPYYSKPCASGALMKGNTFDWTARYAQDIIKGGDFTLSSATQDAIHKVSCHNKDAIMLICGAQREDGYSHRSYPTLSSLTQNIVKQYTAKGGNVMISGAYIGEGLDQNFLRDVFHTEYIQAVSTDSLMVSGMGLSLSLPSGTENERHYSVSRVNSLQATDEAFPTMLFNGTSSAAIAYPGKQHKSLAYGFPLELIEEDEKRAAILNATIRFLTE